MVPLTFKASLEKSSLSFIKSEADNISPLKVKILALTPGTQLPLRDESGTTVAQFEATEELILSAVQRSRGGLINVDHMDPIDSRVGIFSEVTYEGGFLAEGSILCPKWAKIVASGEEAYSGISVEGIISGADINNIDSIDIYSISLLSNENVPQGGACPRGSCGIEIEVDEEELIEAVWDGSAAEKQIWDYATDKDGNIVPSKAKKCFLKVDGDSSQKGSYSYPYVNIANGKPVPNREALISALKYASGAGGAEKDASIIRKIKSIMTKNGMELPPSLQARLDQKIVLNEDGNHEIIVSVSDPITNEIIDIHQVSIYQGEKRMVTEEENKVKVEAAAVVETPPVVEQPETVKASVPEVTSTPAAEVVPVVEAAPAPKTLDWELVSQELGIKSKEDFTLLRQTADKVPELEKKIPDLESKINTIIKENEGLRSFKVETEKKWLQENYPPAVVQDIAAAHAEFSKDPAGFVQKYADDSFKFKAAASAELKGSATESAEAEEARKMLARKEKKNAFLNRTGGPVVR